MKKECLLLIAVMLAGLGSACNEQGPIGPSGELHSDAPGFRPVTHKDDPEDPPGDVPDVPPSGIPNDPSDSGGTGSDPVDDGPQEADLPAGADAFADRVVKVTISDGGGFNQDRLPGVVLGSPKGGGQFQGSFDVLSLGVGGAIVLEMTDYAIFDGDGDDFTVFENAFQVGSDPNGTFAEPGVVGVSNDGETFVDFPCDLTARPYAGCAGVTPVLANPDLNGIDPRDPAVSGGDSFDLKDVGLKTARFVRIRDSALGLGPIGTDTRGFDLDAVAVIHGTLP